MLGQVIFIFFGQVVFILCVRLSLFFESGNLHFFGRVVFIFWERSYLFLGGLIWISNLFYVREGLKFNPIVPGEGGCHFFWLLFT